MSFSAFFPSLKTPASLATRLAALALLSTAPSNQASAAANVYYDTVLVANRAEFQPRFQVDPYLLNPWGIALRPPGAGGHIWISNAGSITTTTYIGDVNGIPLYQDGLKVVPIAGGRTSPGGHTDVTGQVYNAASDIVGQPVEFFVSGPAVNLSSSVPTPLPDTSGAAKFIFVTLDGTINAWRANTATSMKTAVVMKDFSHGGPDEIPTLRYTPAYTGVAITTAGFTPNGQGQPLANNRLYVADFQNNRIQVFNNQWADITASVPFERPAGMPVNYSPFNIQCLDGKLYVAYALLDPDAEERATDLPDDGVGHVAVFDLDGHLIQELADAGKLNSPWGLAIAPANFGAFSGSVLVANFGSGTVAAFDKATGAFQDYLRDSHGEPISVDGIWGLTFGNGVSLGTANSLYYTAGPNGEQDGLFGRLTFTEDPAPPATPTPPPTPPPTPAPAPDADPRVSIQGKSQLTTDDVRLKIAGTASDDHRLVNVTLRVNAGAIRTANGTTNWSANVPLRRGKNKITVRALDDANQASSPDTITVIRK